ncbi:MAG: MBL fold metallo-hydrolase [Hyphomonadaceae bacterium]|nr:MBL fold metallo-hydrolase [Hyphomonadaceae bacterium]
MTHRMSRRAALAGAVATGAAGLSSGRAAAAGRPRRALKAAVGSYPFKVGDYRCLVVSDGQLDFPAQWYAANATPAEYEPLLRARFLPTDVVSNQTSGLVVDTGAQVLLAETGITARWRALTGAPPGSLDRTGTLIPNLRASGVALGDVDAVFVSHGHPDHLGALLDDRGKPMFPRARIFYDRRDYDHHAGPAAMATPERRAETEVSRQVLQRLHKHLELIAPDTEIVTGVRTVDLAGHTPGHCGLMIRSAGETLFHGADLVAHYVLTLARPDWSFYATTDKPVEIAARQRWFATAADEGLRVFFCHVPFPNVGHVLREGRGYRWQPEYFTWG